MLLICAVIYGIKLLPPSSFGKEFGSSNRGNFVTSVSVKSKGYPPLNVLFCLSGNHTGFLAEFVVALKSVLLNAPIDTGMNIHVIGDQEARAALPNILNETQVLTWHTRQPIQIHTYDITNLVKTIRNWKYSICRNHKKILTDESHTIGTFF